MYGEKESYFDTEVLWSFWPVFVSAIIVCLVLVVLWAEKYQGKKQAQYLKEEAAVAHIKYRVWQIENPCYGLTFDEWNSLDYIYRGTLINCRKDCKESAATQSGPGFGTGVVTGAVGGYLLQKTLSNKK